MKCPICGCENLDDYKFCHDCGSPLNFTESIDDLTNELNNLDDFPSLDSKKLIIIGYIIATILVGLLVKTNSINKDTVAESSLLQVFFNLLIWAPITEELIFRALLKKDINNNTLYILMSSLLFAEVHVIGMGFKTNALISMLPYLVLGIYLALLYKKTNNIIINILMHFLINVIGVIMILTMI